MKVNIGRYKKLGRNVNVVIHDHDIYSFDSTLAYIILPALLVLKENQQGIPGEISKVGGEDWDAQLSFDFYNETHNDAFEHKVKEWDSILNKMIWSFQEIVKGDYENEYYYGNAKYETVEVDDSDFLNPITQQKEKLYKMVDTNPDEHWVDIEGLMLHRERIQEGLELFGKYYLSLWS